MTATLLDRHLPRSEHGNVASIDIAAPPATVWSALQRVRLGDCRLSRLLFAVRALPARVARRGAFSPATSVAQATGTPLLESMLRDRFVVLDQRDGEEIVVGAIGRFWQPDGGTDAPFADAAEFAAFETPGYVKAAANIRVVAAAGGTRVSTETRCVSTDASARRRFGAYWALIGWASTLIRRDLLAAVRRLAETDVHEAAKQDSIIPTTLRTERSTTMALQIGDTAPDFEADTTEGRIKFHDWIGDSWAVLFSHPKDFTPVCTTELGYMAKLKPEFDRRGVKIIGLSVDATTDHEAWAKDIEDTQGARPNYPIIGDADFNVAKLYGMLPASTSGDPKQRTPADNQTVRNVFVIGPDKKLKLILVYPMTTGRNFDEVLRVIDSLQLTAKHRVATPVNWKQGDDVIIAGSVSNDEAKEIFGDWEEPRPYIRIVPQPR
jgi:alkyl hydroperoxide reductase subunit AhpC